MKAFLRELVSSDGVPSTRVVSAGALVLAAIVLEFKFATPTNVAELINSNFITAASFFGIYRLGKAVEKVAGTPTVDNSKTNINAETAPVSANNVSVNTPE